MAQRNSFFLCTLLSMGSREKQGLTAEARRRVDGHLQRYYAHLARQPYIDVETLFELSLHEVRGRRPQALCHESSDHMPNSIKAPSGGRTSRQP